jgi:hypothetical protein
MTTSTPVHALDVESLASRFETASAHEIVSWALATFGSRIAVTASMADTVLVHLATSIDPDVEVVAQGHETRRAPDLPGDLLVARDVALGEVLEGHLAGVLVGVLGDHGRARAVAPP